MKIFNLLLTMLVAFVSAIAQPAVSVFRVLPANLHAASIVVNDAFVTSMGAHKPEYRDFLIKNFGLEGHTLYDKIAMLGYTSTFDGVMQTSFSHFEKGMYMDYAAVLNTVADPGAGNPITIAIDPASVVGGAIYPRLNDTVQNVNTGATGYIAQITGTTPNFSIVIQPLKNGVSFGGVVANDQLLIYGNTFAEGTDQPTGRASQVTSFSFNAQIVKETVTTSNSELTNQTWFTWEGKPRVFDGYVMESELRLKKYISGAAMIGETVTDPTAVAAGLRQMTGLIPYIGQYGYTMPYTGGTWQLNNLKAMGKQQVRAFAGKEFMVMQGIGLASEQGDAIGGLFTQNPTILSKRNGDWGYNNTKDVDLDFESITMAGTKIKYQLNTMEELSHPHQWGLPGYSYEGLGLVFPNARNTDPVNKGEVPNLQFRHKEMGGYSRKHRVWYTGGGSDYANTTTIDATQHNMISELGTEIYAGNQFYLIEEI